MALVAEGFDFHIPREYIYFAMAFAGIVEAFNVLARRPILLTGRLNLAVDLVRGFGDQE